MDETTTEPGPALGRAGASAAVTSLGWRYLLGMARTNVGTQSLAHAGAVTGALLAGLGEDAGDSLRIDIRPGCLIITVHSPGTPLLTGREIELVRRISEAITGLGLTTDAGPDGSLSTQQLEIAIDALDIAAVRPFWKAVLGYADEPWAPDPGGGLIDPRGQGPTIWFQQMDAPRPQRNRIHLDITIAHDEAPGRLQAALAAGGTLLSDAHAPSFWILADAEGNEACVCTWQSRDA